MSKFESKYEVGQRIVIAHSFVEGMNGMAGEIVEDGAKEGCDWLVLLDGASRPIKASSYELEPAPATATAAGVVGDSAANPYHWTLPAELVTPEVRTVLTRLQSMLEAKGDENTAKIAELERELAETRDRLNAAEGALKPFAELYDQWLNRLIVDMSFPEWLEIKLTVQEQNGNYTRQYFEDAAKALQAAQATG